MSSEKIIIRVLSKAGRSRVEIAPTSTILDLKTEIAQRLSLEAKTVALCKDANYKQKLNVRDGDTIAKAGLKNGAQLFVSNADTQMTALPESKAMRSYEDIKKEEEKKAEEAPAMDSYGRVLKTAEEETDENAAATDSYGRTLKPTETAQDAKKKPIKMIYNKEDKRRA